MSRVRLPQRQPIWEIHSSSDQTVLADYAAVDTATAIFYLGTTHAFVELDFAASFGAAGVRIFGVMRTNDCSFQVETEQHPG